MLVLTTQQLWALLAYLNTLLNFSIPELSECAGLLRDYQLSNNHNTVQV
jgi:hypothetical protein